MRMEPPQLDHATKEIGCRWASHGFVGVAEGTLDCSGVVVHGEGWMSRLAIWNSTTLHLTTKNIIKSSLLWSFLTPNMEHFPSHQLLTSVQPPTTPNPLKNIQSKSQLPDPVWLLRKHSSHKLYLHAPAPHMEHSLFVLDTHLQFSSTHSKQVTWV